MFLVRSRLHQEHLVILAISFDARTEDRFQRTLVKGGALPRSEVPSFGGRWSAAPPDGGSPFLWVKEPSLNGRRSHGFCHPGPTRRRPSRDESTTRVLRQRVGAFIELVPARPLSATCLTDDWRKQCFFGLRRSDRISATRYDARARPDGLLLLSSAGLQPHSPCDGRYRLRDEGVAWRAMHSA